MRARHPETACRPIGLRRRARPTGSDLTFQPVVHPKTTTNPQLFVNSRKIADVSAEQLDKLDHAVVFAMTRSVNEARYTLRPHATSKRLVGPSVHIPPFQAQSNNSTSTPDAWCGRISTPSPIEPAQKKNCHH